MSTSSSSGAAPQPGLPEGVQLRRLELADAEACAEFEKELFPQDSPWSAASFQYEIQNPSALYLGITVHGELVGYAGLGMLGTVQDPEFELRTIGVTGAFQGRGLGRIMLNEFIDVADQYGGPIFLEVRTDNEPAIGLYASAGFEWLGVRKNYYQPSGADAYSMRRPPALQ